MSDVTTASLEVVFQDQLPHDCKVDVYTVLSAILKEFDIFGLGDLPTSMSDNEGNVTTLSSSNDDSLQDSEQKRLGATATRAESLRPQSENDQNVAQRDHQENNKKQREVVTRGSKWCWEHIFPGELPELRLPSQWIVQRSPTLADHSSICSTDEEL